MILNLKNMVLTWSPSIMIIWHLFGLIMRNTVLDKSQIHQLKVNMKSLVTFRGSDYDLFVNSGKV